MNKNKKNKFFVITILLLIVGCLTVGFAAFQRLLNISSSAEVSLPSEENFDIELYGITSLEELEDLQNDIIDFSKHSKEKAYPTDITFSKFYSDYYAVINNENLTINIDNVVLKGPGDGYIYYFILRNNSAYGVYTYVSDEIKEIYSSGLRGACQAAEGTSQELVDKVCRNITVTIADSELFKGTYKLSANDAVLIPIVVGYGNTSYRADGEFLVDFPPITIEFDIIPHTYDNLNTVEEDA